MNKTIFALALALYAVTGSYSQCACCAGAGIGSSNGDYNNGIVTLPHHSWVVETYTDYRKVNQDANGADVILNDEESPLESMLIESVGVRYGLTDKLTLSALMPYVFLNTPTGNDSGLADLILMGTYAVWQKNNFSVALQAGVELPTGIQKEGTFDNETVVVGSGSFDPMAGIIVSKRWDKFALQANGLYKQTTKGFQGNYYGSIAIQNLSLGYSIRRGSGSCAVMTTATDTNSTTAPSTGALGWSVFGGYYGEWLNKLKEDDITDENSGYYMGFATLGNTLSYKGWSFPLTLSLPMVQNMNGDQSAGGFRLRLGIIKSF